jgi:hypothetical protein
MIGIFVSLTLACIVPPSFADPAFSTTEEASSATRMRATCYLPTGYSTYDGTIPYEGVISSNKEHVGKTALLWDENTGEFIGRFECHDIGGNSQLRAGTAIDIYRDNMSNALEWVRIHGDYVLVEWE